MPDFLNTYEGDFDSNSEIHRPFYREIPWFWRCLTTSQGHRVVLDECELKPELWTLRSVSVLPKTSTS